MRTRAVMFDFAGTIVTGIATPEGRAERHGRFMRSAGLEGLDAARVGRAIQEGMSRATDQICKNPFYLQRDLLAVGFSYAAEIAGGDVSREDAQAYAAASLRGLVLEGGPREGAFDTLNQLRRRGFHLGVVSNIEESDLSSALDAHGLRPSFDFVLSSEAARSCKPDSGIFEQAVRTSGHPASETLFVGDTPAHDIDGAAAAGMRTALIRAEGESAMRKIEGQYEPDHVIDELPELLRILA